MWHPAIPHVDARFRKRARETYISHISGIRTLENQLISMQTLDSQARAQDTHQWHHSTSKPAIPHVDAPFQKRVRETNISGITASHESPFTPFPHVDARFHTQAQISGSAAEDGVSRTFHCILEHILESNPQVDAALSRRMNRCPGYRKALEIHIPSFDPLAAAAGHDLWSNINDIKNHQNQPIPMVTLDSCVCVCVCLSV